MTEVPQRRGDGATRGFLFCDLRGYTQVVDRHGASAAADMLERYRELVRTAVAEHAGGEIRTEGDSFYVVFKSVSEALSCGLDIIAAASSSLHPSGERIPVGVGVDAGETVETPDGYVGQSVNVAARLCALAPAGEVLVTETVRALTQSVLPVEFTSRGRRRLKGIAEPIQVYSAKERGTFAAVRRRRNDRRVVLGLVSVGAVAMLVLAGVSVILQPAVFHSGPWTIGVTLPLTGLQAEDARPLHLAVQLAVEDATGAGLLEALNVRVDVRDSGDAEFGEDRAKAVAAAQAIVADQTAIALIGPLNSFAAAEQIRITNRAGLLHCGPSTTDPNLTRPEMLDRRLPEPERLNFVRLPPPADIEARAAASFAFHDLRSSHALVVDDTQEVGRLVADSFEREFVSLGGRVTRRALNPGGDAESVLISLGEAGAPTLVFFGGFTGTGAPAVRREMAAAGYADLPFMGWDGMWDGSGQEEGSFIQLTGSAAQGSYVSHPSLGPVERAFEVSYRDAYGEPPPGLLREYSAASYACAQIALQSLKAAATSRVAVDSVREAVRAYAVDPEHSFDTVLDDVSFDANGESDRQIVAFYRVDLNAAGGAGDWQLYKQENFASAP